MLRVQLVTPEKFQWLKGYTEALNGYDVVVTGKATEALPDVKVFLWCNQDTVDFVNTKPKTAKHIVYIRRYELFSPFIHQIEWNKVDAIVLVNDVFKSIFESMFSSQAHKTHLIYNSVSLEDWTYKERGPGKNIAMVGWVNQKKNFPLAVQIMAALPKGYILHIAGGIQCEATAAYLGHMAKTLKLDIRFYGRQKDINEWLEPMNYLLSCAISEGNPNCCIESLSKGIKTVVHNWPGAQQQFGDWMVFNSVYQAVNLIESPIYSSGMYRELVETRFGPANFQRFRKLVDEVANG